MKELNLVEVDTVSGGFQNVGPLGSIAISIASSALYDFLKPGAIWLWSNSYAGRNEFPPVPRAGHE